MRARDCEKKKKERSGIGIGMGEERTEAENIFGERGGWRSKEREDERNHAKMRARM